MNHARSIFLATLIAALLCVPGHPQMTYVPPLMGEGITISGAWYDWWPIPYSDAVFQECSGPMATLYVTDQICYPYCASQTLRVQDNHGVLDPHTLLSTQRDWST